MTRIYDRIALDLPRYFLREFTGNDAERLSLLAGVPSVAQFTWGIPLPYPSKAARAWIDGIAKRREDGIERVFAISYGQKLVGAIGLTLEWEHLRAEVGYWIGERYRGRGVAGAALRKACEIAFEQLCVRRVYAHVLAGNVPSTAMLRAAGFQREGHLRQHVVKWHKSYDVLIFGLTATRYQKLRARSGADTGAHAAANS
jgi:[ribosomal protein S5]-alanine N-acetyltransferase